MKKIIIAIYVAVVALLTVQTYQDHHAAKQAAMNHMVELKTIMSHSYTFKDVDAVTVLGAKINSRILGEHSTLTVLDEKNNIIVRYPDIQDIKGMHMQVVPADGWVAKSPIDKIERMFTAIPMSNGHTLVIASAEMDYMAAWNRSAFQNVIAGIAMTIFMVVVMIYSRKVEALATTDGLTGLINRRELDKQAQRVISLCTRTDTPVTMLAIDADGFKLVNDTLGHHGGDKALQAISEAMGTVLRNTDITARRSGDEFVCVLHSDLEGARIAATALRQAVESTGLVTISIGIAEAVKGDSVATLMARADAALYRSKASGKNQISI